MKLLFLFLTVLLFGACAKERCLGEAGPSVTVSRALPPFHQLEVYDNVNVVLVQDSLEKIAIVAPQFLEPNITAVVENGSLQIRNESTCTGLRRASETFIAYVHLKNIDRLEYAGSGSITSADTILAGNFYINSKTGAGTINLKLHAKQTFSYIMDENADIILEGSSDICFSYTASRGTIDFSRFTVKKMNIEYGGLRDAQIHVTDELSAILYYKGNLFYTGQPRITMYETHSNGQLIYTP